MDVLDARALERTPGVNLDDRLRAVPGFTLFRRNSSLAANPTTQGISLRGLGSSGASRTLLLWDGIPENDPFGGWVYWDRFAPDELERVEISRGASTSVFGDLAMGGAIALFSRAPQPRRFEAAYEGGNRDTHEASLGGSNLWRSAAVSGYARAFTTDGYFIVPRAFRGPIDTAANVKFVAGDARLDLFGPAGRLFLRLDILAEHRDNGTALTSNSTSLGSIAANYSREWARDQLSALAYHTREAYRASFSAIGPNRAAERLTSNQTVPSEGVGGAAFWRHSQARWHALAGGDASRAAGVSTDRLFPAGERVGGGSQLEHGVFGQFDAAAGPVRFFVGARHEFTGRGNTFFSPSGGVAAARGRLRARASAYRSFRAPTLNELYREFRAGNTITQANAALRPETATGAEVGVDFLGETTHAGLTLYRTSLRDLITNVTLQTGSAIVRQRQNAAAALARGVEANLSRQWGRWRGELAYLLADSRYRNGLRIAQTPRHQGSGQISYRRAGTLASLGVRSYSAQFDDDLNQFRLPGFAAVQLALDQRLGKSVTARAAFDNLLDRQYLVGFTPTPNIGSPRLWRVGLRWQLR